MAPLRATQLNVPLHAVIMPISLGRKVRGVTAIGSPGGITRMSALRMLCRYRHSIRGADYYAATSEEDRC